MKSLDKWLFYLAMAFVVYMPLHIFISQSAPLITGGLEVWKAAKDVLLVVLVPGLLYVSYRRGLFEDTFFRRFIIFAGLYTLLHGLFVLFYRDFSGWYATIIGSVYNTRIFGFFLLGYLVGTSKKGKEYLRYLLTASLLVAFVVALFGVMQYFLPTDLLEHVGYSVERGVKPLFFIDDKPDFPRVMSTIRDPNSLGAYLIIPMLFTLAALTKQRWNEQFFVRPFRKAVLGIFLAIFSGCMFLTFSRGALLSLILSIGVYAVFVYGRQTIELLKKYWWVAATAVLLIAAGSYLARDTYVYKNVVFHADEATTKADPNEKRLILYEEAWENIQDRPVGYGPGSAGIVSEKSDSGQILTENYALQILHETGVIGLILFTAVTVLLVLKLYELKNEPVAMILLASLAGYLFYGLLVHIWSNEAVALQWWLLTGAVIGISTLRKRV